MKLSYRIDYRSGKVRVLFKQTAIQANRKIHQLTFAKKIGRCHTGALDTFKH